VWNEPWRRSSAPIAAKAPTAQREPGRQLLKAAVGGPSRPALYAHADERESLLENLPAHHEIHIYWAMIIVMTRRLVRQPAASKALTRLSETYMIEISPKPVPQEPYS
jgi:hypothetical protein